MKTYDPGKPLISLHIPKCAGQSFRPLLENWFGEKFRIHYFQEKNAPPGKHELIPGLCIHGHFNRLKNWGADQYYPGVDQFITVLRDPLETAISNYFFWKKKGRARQIKRGDLEPGGAHDYRDIDDFFEKRPRSHILNFMPCAIDRENYKNILETRFIWIGLVERLQEDVDRLAAILGFEPVKLAKLNVSERNEELSPQIAEKFVEENPLEFEIYHYLKQMHQAG